jgi:hypothetical protein
MLHCGAFPPDRKVNNMLLPVLFHRMEKSATCCRAVLFHRTEKRIVWCLAVLFHRMEKNTMCCLVVLCQRIEKSPACFLAVFFHPMEKSTACCLPVPFHSMEKSITMLPCCYFPSDGTRMVLCLAVLFHRMEKSPACCLAVFFHPMEKSTACCLATCFHRMEKNTMSRGRAKSKLYKSAATIQSQKSYAGYVNYEFQEKRCYAAIAEVSHWLCRMRSAYYTLHRNEGRMAEVLHWPQRSGPSFRRKSTWTTAAVRAPPSPYRLHRKPNPQHFRRGIAPATRKLTAAAGIPAPGTSAPLPEHRGATPHLFRRVGWTARRQIPSLEGSLTGDRVFRARCRRNLRGRGFRSDSNSASAQSYTCSPCRLAQRAAKRWFSIG